MAAIANMVGQGGIPPGLGSDPTAANITAANLANLAMRLGVTQVITKNLFNKVRSLTKNHNYS